MDSLLIDRQVVAIGGEASILPRIVSPDTHLSVWRRVRPNTLVWLDGLDWDAIDDLEFPTSIACLALDVGDALIEAGYPEDEDRAALAEDIVARARDFAAAMDCTQIRIRLEVVDTDACRRFHSDAVTARLLTTLAGTGTDWIEAAAPEVVNRLGTGDVAIFKGRVWANDPAILHRSPPIAGTGEMRLLLVIDAIDPAAVAPIGV